jgi:hypothetical protein
MIALRNTTNKCKDHKLDDTETITRILSRIFTVWVTIQYKAVAISIQIEKST